VQRLDHAQVPLAGGHVRRRPLEVVRLVEVGAERREGGDGLVLVGGGGGVHRRLPVVVRGVHIGAQLD
jgi:hypothetical protein